MSNVLVVTAIDPGSNTMGYATIHVHLDELSLTLKDAFTFSVSKMAKLVYKEDLYPARRQNLAWLEDRLVEHFKRDESDFIIAENSFMSVNVNSFAVLIECRNAIYNAVNRHNDHLRLELIDPLSVKYGIGAIERGKKAKDTKLAVRQKIPQLVDLMWGPNVMPIDQLDEHSVDAISIAYYAARQLLDKHIEIETDICYNMMSLNLNR